MIFGESLRGAIAPLLIDYSPSPLKSPEATRLVRGEVADSTRRGDKGGEVDITMLFSLDSVKSEY